MLIEDYVSCLRSDKDYTLFVNESCWLYLCGIISSENLNERFNAIQKQIQKQ